MMRTILALPLLAMSACSTSDGPAASPPELVAREQVQGGAASAGVLHELRGDRAVAVYRSDIDRLISFRAPGGPEMLFTQLLDQPALADEQYTFYGGAYSWTAPQNGALGWVGPDGEPRAWPPDPVMNVGPAEVQERAEAMTSVTGVSRLGLVERKAFAMTDAGMDVRFSLDNTTDEPVAAGTWINTAVHDDAVVAVRLVGPDALASLRGWDRQSIDRFISILDRKEDGWAIVKLGEASWEGGIKVYVPRIAGELPTIAVWRDGQWLVRTQRVTEAATNTVGRLTTLGEGAVAMYVQPGSDESAWIIEAELYGPIVDIPARGTHQASEFWTLIASEEPDTSVLPVTEDPAAVR